MAGQDILSQDEVDALLGMDGDDLGDRGPAPGEVREIDLANHERVVRSRLPALETINERISRSLRDLIFNLFRRGAAVSNEGLVTQTFADYIYSLYVPTSLNVVRLTPLRGFGIVAIDPRLVFRLVDFFFGGTGTLYSKVEGRDFTATEQRLIRLVVERICALMTESWKSVVEVDVSYSHAEVHRRSANILNQKEVVVVSSFSLELETGDPGYIHITLPYTMLEPIQAVLDAPVAASREQGDNRWSVSLRRDIRNVSVPVRSELTTFRSTLSQLLTWRVGDVLPVDLPELVDLEVEGLPLASGRFGISNDRNALRIETVKEPEAVWEGQVAEA
jgi:flagellar motor switch protein FliM